jgi:hypothetical protein
MALLLPRLDDERTYHCRFCQDEPSGWLELWCRGYGEGRVHVDQKPKGLTWMQTGDCGRTTSHPPHTAVDRCACLDSNPVRARLRERWAQAKAERAAASRPRRAS